MARHGLKGTIVFFGEPAEKLRLSKPVHAAKGYYDDLDAAISFHPAYMLPLVNTVRLDTHCGAGYAAVYSFECAEPERWLTGEQSGPIPVSHVAARAPGAPMPCSTCLPSPSRRSRTCCLSRKDGRSARRF